MKHTLHTTRRHAVHANKHAAHAARLYAAKTQTHSKRSHAANAHKHSIRIHEQQANAHAVQHTLSARSTRLARVAHTLATHTHARLVLAACHSVVRRAGAEESEEGRSVRGPQGAEKNVRKFALYIIGTQTPKIILEKECASLYILHTFVSVV